MKQCIQLNWLNIAAGLFLERGIKILNIFRKIYRNKVHQKSSFWCLCLANRSMVTILTTRKHQMVSLYMEIGISHFFGRISFKEPSDILLQAFSILACSLFMWLSSSKVMFVSCFWSQRMTFWLNDSLAFLCLIS